MPLSLPAAVGRPPAALVAVPGAPQAPGPAPQTPEPAAVLPLADLAIPLTTPALRADYHRGAALQQLRNAFSDLNLLLPGVGCCFTRQLGARFAW